jgi:hypothetical protein
MVLIPATSVKGALSHRTAFHWNRLNGYFAGNPEAKVGYENEAVRLLFGYEDQATKTQQRGNLLFSDVIEAKESVIDKVLNHVAIDRFTGGAIEGALFSEKTSYGKGQTFEMTIMAKRDALIVRSDKDVTTQEALEGALQDICKGLLPLGGGVNRGNGVFMGTLSRDGEVIS